MGFAVAGVLLLKPGNEEGGGKMYTFLYRFEESESCCIGDEGLYKEGDPNKADGGGKDMFSFTESAADIENLITKEKGGKRRKGSNRKKKSTKSKLAAGGF